MSRVANFDEIVKITTMGIEITFNNSLNFKRGANYEFKSNLWL